MIDGVFIGLGSNLGDRLANLRTALGAIAELDETHVAAVSNVVESEPWGVTDQPRFANAVARVTTAMPAGRFLESLQDIERTMGRTPGERNGPRVIDLDILLFGDEEWASPDLVVPHPRLAERDFAVTPLLEIAPDATWPDGSPITRDRATEGRITRTLGPVPGLEGITPAPGGSAADGRTDADGWEAVASAHFGVHQGTELAMELQFDAVVLEQEGVRIAWDPVPPVDDVNLWLQPRTYHLLVPSAQADHARAILADAHASGAVLEGMPPAGPGYDEDEFGEPILDEGARPEGGFPNEDDDA